jgi:hypothetical protein
MITNFPRDLPFSRDPPLKSFGDQCIRISKNKIKILDDVSEIKNPKLYFTFMVPCMVFDVHAHTIFVT